MWLELATAGNAQGMDLWTLMLGAHWVSKIVFLTLIGCSILSIAVIVERWIVLRRARTTTARALEQLDAWAMAQQWDSAREEVAHATRASTPLLSVLRAGVAYWQELVAVGETRLEVMETMVTEAVGRELKLVRAGLRANLPILANIASVAPFIGLFGTVVGIILTFDAIHRSGNMGQELVASGIADALVATAMGLFAAIPAVIAYNFFTDKITHAVLEMEEVALERIYFLVQREQANGSEPTFVKSPTLVATHALDKE
jgi:biopolymer transport protein ExbB/TolQ